MDINLPPQLQDFITLFLGLIVEAFPFVIIGVLVSAIIGAFVDEAAIHKFIPKNKFLSHLAISLLGFLMPVCECGNVPVVRSLIAKGFSVSQAVTFMLAAPIVNPITFWATITAFSFEPSVAFIRIGAAILISNVVGLLVSLKQNQEQFLTDSFIAECEHHHHEPNKYHEAVGIFRDEFVTVMRMLIVGATIAAASQSFIPREVILAVGNNNLLSVIAMMILAFVISICANVDAFFALSYASQFSLGSILSFLVFGPMIDIKMLAMLRTTFTTRFLAMMTAVVALSALVLGLLVNLL